MEEPPTSTTTASRAGRGSRGRGRMCRGVRRVAGWMLAWAGVADLSGAEVPTNKVVALDGAGSYVALPDGLGADWEAATIEMRVCWDGNSYYGTPLQFGDAKSSLGFNQAECFPAPRVYCQKAGGHPSTLSMEEGLDPGMWVHVAATFEAERMRFWVNGTCLGTNAFAGPGLTLLTNAPARWLGRSAWKENGYFFGRIDELRLWNRILSDEEIARLPHQRVNGAEEGLQARWSMDVWGPDGAKEEIVCWSDGALRLPAALRGRARAIVDGTPESATYDAPWWVEGTVRGPEGLPVNAEVNWLEVDNRSWHLLTDQNGQFRWRGVRRGRSERIRIFAGDFGRWSEVNSRPGVRTSVDWVLDAQPSVEGSVVRWDGLARSGVRVRIRPSDPQAPQPSEGWMTRTGRNGRFVFSALPDGDYDVECDAGTDPFVGRQATSIPRQRIRIFRAEGPTRVTFRVSTTGDDRVWRRFTARDGLPDNSVTTMASDDRGGLWVGTSSGLAWFDGMRFTTWTRSDGLPGDSVSALAFDVDSRLWVAGDEGLVVKTGDRFEPVAIGSGMPGMRVFDMVGSDDGAVWLATDQGVHRLANGSWKSFGVEEGLPAQVAFVLWPVESDAVRVFTQGGLWARLTEGKVEHHPTGRWLPWGTDPLACREAPVGRLAGGAAAREWKRSGDPLWRNDACRTRVEEMDFPGSHEIRRILEIPGQATWVATYHQGLLRFAPEATRSLTPAHGLPSAQVSVSLRARDGAVWIGTAAGLVRWSAAGPTQFGEADGLPRIDVKDLLEAADGAIWVAGSRGIFRWVGGRFVALPGVPIADFPRLCRDRHGVIWALGSGQGVYRAEDSGLVSAYADGLQPYVWALDMLALSTGELCLASLRGLVAVRDRKVERLRMPDSPLEPRVLSLLESRDGTLWVGSESDGLMRRDPLGHWSHFRPTDGLSSRLVSALHEDARGWLWVGTSQGVSLYRDGLWSRLDSRDGLAGNYVRHIRSEADGSVWFATDGGLTRYVPLQFPPMAAWKDESQAEGGRTSLVALRGNSGQRIDFAVEAAGESRVRWRVSEGDRVGAWSALRDDPHWAWIPTNAGRAVVEAQVFDRDLNASEIIRKVVRIQAEWYRRPAVVVPAGAAALGVTGTLIYLGTMLRRQRMVSARLRDEARLLAAADVARMEFERRLIRTQEAERGRIARELHDSLGQELLLIRQSALLAWRAAAATDPGPALGEIADRAARSIEEVRSIAYALRPQELDRYGLAAAMRALCDDVASGSNPVVEFVADAELPPLGSEVEIGLFRILQECLTNALKHARAVRVACSLRRRDGGVELRVSDDGAGFDPATKIDTDAAGLGLNGMRERVRLLGGHFELASRPGEGTTVTVWIPGTHRAEPGRPNAS